MPNPSPFDNLRRYSAAEIESGLALFSTRPRDENALGSGLRWLSSKRAPMIGYAVTAEMSGDSGDAAGRIENVDWWDFVQRQPGPKVVVVRDVSAVPGRSVLCGRLSGCALLASGCVGFLTDGAVRDSASLDQAGFTLIAKATTVSHGSPHVVRFGTPISMDGVTISTGDVIFADAEGSVVFPLSMLPDVPRAVDEVNRRLRPVLEYCHGADFSASELNARIERHMKFAPKFQPGVSTK